MSAAALSRSGKRCIRVSRGRCPGRTRVREPPQPPGLASSPHLACLACPCICAGCGSDGCGRIDRSGSVLHHTSPSRTARQGAPVAQGVPLALGRRQVERLPHTRRVLGGGWLCGAHRACAAAATTKHLHARARTKTRGNPDRGTRVPATKSCGLPRVCIAVGAAAQVRMRATARCKYKIVSDISCDSAHVQQQHDTS